MRHQLRMGLEGRDWRFVLRLYLGSIVLVVVALLPVAVSSGTRRAFALTPAVVLALVFLQHAIAFAPAKWRLAGRSKLNAVVDSAADALDRGPVALLLSAAVLAWIPATLASGVYRTFIWAGSTLLAIESRTRHRRPALVRHPEERLSPQGKQVLDDFALRLKQHLALADASLQEALMRQRVGHEDAARRALTEGVEEIERLSTHELTLLRAMSDVSKELTSVTQEVRPLQPHQFRLKENAHFALVNRDLHDLCVTNAERLDLRVKVLAGGLKAVMRNLHDSKARIDSGDPSAAREWDHIQSLRDDYSLIAKESLVSLQTLFTAVADESGVTEAHTS